ncbi:hypothetical protein BC936DRAFT_141867, partial [Jimgerdemannia flammicorona]
EEKRGERNEEGNNSKETRGAADRQSYVGVREEDLCAGMKLWAGSRVEIVDTKGLWVHTDHTQYYIPYRFHNQQDLRMQYLLGARLDV